MHADLLIDHYDRHICLSVNVLGTFKFILSMDSQTSNIPCSCYNDITILKSGLNLPWTFCDLSQTRSVTVRCFPKDYVTDNFAGRIAFSDFALQVGIVVRKKNYHWEHRKLKYILGSKSWKPIKLREDLNLNYSLQRKKKVCDVGCLHCQIVGDGKICRKWPFTSRVVCEGSAGSIAFTTRCYKINT